MGKPNKSDELLKLICVCGELPTEWVEYAVGSKSYSQKLIAKLKREGYIKIRYKDKLKGCVLRSGGKKYLMERFGSDCADYLAGAVETNKMKSEPTQRLRLHRMGGVWAYLYSMGINIHKSEKPPFHTPSLSSIKQSDKAGFYYGSVEVKNGEDKAGGGSRACGVLLSKSNTYAVYNTMDSLMKWAAKTERTFKSRTEGELRRAGLYGEMEGIIFGKGMEVMTRMLESDGGVKGNLYRLDDTYDKVYFVPMLKEAEVQVRLRMDDGKRTALGNLLGQMIIKKSEHGPEDGWDADGNPVYLCHELEMWKLWRIKRNWDGGGKVVCFDYQEGGLREWLGEGVEIMGINAKTS